MSLLSLRLPLNISAVVGASASDKVNPKLCVDKYIVCLAADIWTPQELAAA